MTEYISLNSYCKKVFGCKVYKISLSCSNSCPNRDGTVGTGGCIFCSAGGSGEFAGNYCDDIHTQIKNAKALVAKKAKTNKYIAYFQSFTSTYGDIAHIKHCVKTAAEDGEVVAVSLATRPDCLPREILEFLSEINKTKPVWIELGLQTANDGTAKLINRGTRLCDFTYAISTLKSYGFYVILHIILGLPGETDADMLSTVDYAVAQKADGIKLQLLHILKGTPLEKMYLAGEFTALTLSEYVSLIERCLMRIPKTVTVHRITGDGDKRLLVAPLWSKDKKRVMGELQKYVKAVEL